jgi:hypothetical protein
MVYRGGPFLFCLFYFVLLRQDFVMQHRLAYNLSSFCLSLLQYCDYRHVSCPGIFVLNIFVHHTYILGCSIVTTQKWWSAFEHLNNLSWRIWLSVISVEISKTQFCALCFEESVMKMTFSNVGLEVILRSLFFTMYLFTRYNFILW